MLHLHTMTTVHQFCTSNNCTHTYNIIHIIIIRTDVDVRVVTLPLWAILLLVVLPFFVIASLVGMGIACKCLSIKREKRIIAASSIEK